jgi:hypothetical protein
MRSSKATNSRLGLCAVLLLALRLAAQNSDKPASVEGTVIDSVSRAPVPRAQVTLRGEYNGRPVQYGATSAADGTFSISDIPAGIYSAMGQRVGFVNPPDPRTRTRVTLKPGDRETGVEIELTPTGSITGRVTDSDGDPVEGAAVSAAGIRGGGDGITDEKGQFRIGGLAPGKYSVSADRNETFGPRPEIRTDGTVELHQATTYYPSALTQADAGKVVVRAAAESSGIDIRLVRVPFVRVSGRVVGMPSGAEQTSLMVSQRNGEIGRSLASDGSFELWRLNPGKYTLSADWRAPNGEEVHTAGVQIEVAESNLDGIELRVIPDSNIAGRVDFEDDRARQMFAKTRPGPDVTLIAVGDYDNSASTSPIGADGTFHLDKVPAGKYRVRVEAGTAYIKSMWLGGAAIEGTLLDLSRGSEGADLSLLLSAATSSVSGVVQDEGLKGLVVVMTIADEETGADPLDATVGADGRYEFDNVPPGNYKLVAVPENEAAVQGSNVLGYEDLMEAVRVGEQENVTKDLRRQVPADR